MIAEVRDRESERVRERKKGKKSAVQIGNSDHLALHSLSTSYSEN